MWKLAGARTVLGLARSARTRSRTATLPLETGSAYVLGPTAAGKTEAGPEGMRIKHAVPQSADGQLTLGFDVDLPDNEVQA